jgi:hypothetical protein
MQSAEPTPLRYYPSPKEKLDFRRPKRRPFRVWPFAVAVLLLAGAIGGLLVLMEGDARPGIALLAPPGTADGASSSGG